MPQCPYCESQEPALLECDFPDVLQCPSCQFIFADPEKVAESPASYEEAFADHTLHPTYQKVDGEYVIRNRHKLSRLLEKLARYKKTGRILDVGCSAAFFLKLAEEYGWKPQGAEISEFGASFSNEELGIDVFHGTLQEAAYDDGRFDVVFSSHVMEHIEQPLDVLNEMKRVLRPGGAVVTVIPTQFASPSYRFWKKLYGDGPPRHVSFYTKRSYSAFLEKAGFKVRSAIYNVELDRLKQLLKHGKVTGGAVPSADGSAPKKPAKQGYGNAVFMLKALINRGATIGGIGDELLVIATKPE